MLARTKVVYASLLGYFVGAQIAFGQNRPDFSASGFRVDTTNIPDNFSFSKLVYQKLGEAFTSVYYILVAIALLIIIVGIIRYFAPGGQEEQKRKNTIFLLTWGLISFVVLISIVPILAIVKQTLNF